MFRALIPPIFRNTRLCVTACGMMHRRYIIPQAVNTQSSVPEDGRDQRPKHVELIGIITKSSLLHLVGCLYYLYEMCGLVSSTSVRNISHSMKNSDRYHKFN